MIKSKPAPAPVSADRLKSFIERMERVQEEIKGSQGDLRDLFSEAKGVGYDVKTMRKVLTLRKMDPADRAEQEALLDVYLHALGMIDRLEARAAAGESAREIAAAENVSKSTAHRASQKARGKKASAEMGQAPKATIISPPEAADLPLRTGEIKSAGPDTPLCEGAGTTDKPDGPGSVLAINPNVAPGEDARAAQSLPLPDADDGVSRAGTSSEQEALAAGEDGECLSGRVSRSDEHSTAGFEAGNSAHEGESDGRTSDSGEQLRSNGSGAGPIDRDGEPVRVDGRQSASTERYAGLDRGAAGAVRADSEAAHRGQGAPDDRSETRIAGGAARVGELDGRSTQSSGRDLLAAGRAAVANGEEAAPTNEVGAVAEPSSAQRVTSQTLYQRMTGSFDPGPIPPRLDRRPARAT